MGVRNRLGDFLFYIITVTLYCYAITDTILSATVITAPTQSVLLACVGFAAAFYLIFLNKYTVIASLALSVAGVIAVVVIVMAALPPAEGIRDLGGFLSELVQFARNKVEHRSGYDLPVTLWIAFVTCFFAALNTRAMYNYVFLLILAAAATAVPIIMDWGKAERSTLILIFCLLAFLAKKLNMQAFFTGGKSQSAYAGYVLALLPLAAGIVLLSWLLPKPMDPEDGGSSGGFGGAIGNAASNLIGSLTPSRILAFSEDGEKLGGPVFMSDEVVMRVHAPERLYLAGSVRDTYTGAGWSLSDRSQTRLEGDTAFAVGEYGGDIVSAQDYFMRYYSRKQERAKITLEDNRTKMIFAPPFAQNLTMTESTAVLMNAAGSLSTQKLLPAFSSYDISYNSWDYRNVYTQAVLREYAAQRPGTSASGMADYLQLPETLPQRVRNLTAELTAGHTNNYDKLKAIEGYLARFPYTLTPAATPNGADFVDNFIFEEEQGYCVYYASAMAVMGRCAGIPTRYVEGFITPESMDASGAYVVTNAQAHAWVQAFFPGFGWVQFEPTAPYAVLDPVQPPVQPPEQPEVFPRDDEAELNQPDPSRPDVEAETATSTPPEQPSRPDNGQSEPESTPAGADAPRGWPVPAVITAVVFVLLLFAAAALTMAALRHRKHQRKRSSMSDHDYVIDAFAGIVAAVRSLGFPMQSGETAIAFAQRVAPQLDGTALPDVALPSVARIFSQACYSPQEIAPEDRALMAKSLDSVGGLLESTHRFGLFYRAKRAAVEFVAAKLDRGK